MSPESNKIGWFDKDALFPSSFISVDSIDIDGLSRLSPEQLDELAELLNPHRILLDPVVKISTAQVFPPNEKSNEAPDEE